MGNFSAAEFAILVSPRPGSRTRPRGGPERGQTKTRETHVSAPLRGVRAPASPPRIQELEFGDALMSEGSILEASETRADFLKHNLDGLKGCLTTFRSLLALSGNVSQKLWRFAVE
jgi:hypothetical protein